MKNFLILFFLLFYCTMVKSDVLQDAQSLYDSKKYTEASVMLEAALDNDSTDVALLYNLGLTYNKIDSLGACMYYLHKAHLYSPNNSKIADAITIASQKIISPPKEMEQIRIIKWFKNIKHFCNATTWTWISIVSFFMLLVSITLMYYDLIHSRVCILIRVFFIMVCFFTSINAWQRHSYEMDSHKAVVIANKITGKNQAFDNAEDNFIIHEGTLVTIVNNEENQWYKVLLNDGREGYIPKQSVRKI